MAKKESAEVRNLRAMHVAIRPILSLIREQGRILSETHGPILSRRIYRYILIEIIEQCHLMLDTTERWNR